MDQRINTANQLLDEACEGIDKVLEKLVQDGVGKKTTPDMFADSGYGEHSPPRRSKTVTSMSSVRISQNRIYSVPQPYPATEIKQSSFIQSPIGADKRTKPPRGWCVLIIPPLKDNSTPSKAALSLPTPDKEAPAIPSTPPVPLQPDDCLTLTPPKGWCVLIIPPLKDNSTPSKAALPLPAPDKEAPAIPSTPSVPLQPDDCLTLTPPKGWCVLIIPPLKDNSTPSKAALPLPTPDKEAPAVPSTPSVPLQPDDCLTLTPPKGWCVLIIPPLKDNSTPSKAALPLPRPLPPIRPLQPSTFPPPCSPEEYEAKLRSKCCYLIICPNEVELNQQISLQTHNQNPLLFYPKSFPNKEDKKDIEPVIESNYVTTPKHEVSSPAKSHSQSSKNY